MHSKSELATSIRNAMEAKHLSQHQLTELLKMNSLMIDKLLSGDIIPSSHLKKQLIEVLGIPRDKVAKRAEHRSKQAQVE